jgi:hypothetical protein
VAGRPDQRETAALDRVERAARREERRLPARLRGNRVRVEQGRNLDRREPVEVSGVVAALYLLTRGGPALDYVEGLEQRLEPRARFDVRLRRVELGERGVAYEVRLTASARSSSEAEPCARPTR